VVVPSVGIVVHDDHSRVLPGVLVFEEVYGIDDEGLLIQRIRISRVAVLVGRSLQEAYCREVPGGNRSKEVQNIVLMVRGSVVANFRDGIWTSVLRIRGRGVITQE